MPFGKYERDDQCVEVRDEADDKRYREPGCGLPCPEDQRRCDEQCQTERPAGPRVVARIAAELSEVEQMTANLHKGKRGNQNPMRANNAGMHDPDRARDADIEKSVRNTVESAEAGGGDAKASSNPAVVDV